MSNFCPTCRKDHDDSHARCPGCGDPLPSRATSGSLVGRLIDGRYHIESRLGEGGMGEVYVAHQAAVGRKVALKRLLPEHSGKPQIGERFGREARAMACLESEHTIRLFDFGSVDGAPYFTMELLEGSTLEEDIAAAGFLTPDRALSVVEQVCDSLEDAHAHGLLHRDLKPANIFLAQDRKLGERVKVLDFGIAKFLDDEEERLTAVGDVVGTPHYVSPEALRGDNLDGRVDLYALGVIVYEMLAGACPLLGRTPLEIIAKHLTEIPRPVHEAYPQAKVPRPVSDFLVRALDKDPEVRPETPAAFVEALREAVEEGRRLGEPDMAVTSPGLATGPLGGASKDASPLTAKATPSPFRPSGDPAQGSPEEPERPEEEPLDRDARQPGGAALKAVILAIVVAFVVVVAAWMVWSSSGGAAPEGPDVIQATTDTVSAPAASPDVTDHARVDDARDARGAEGDHRGAAADALEAPAAQEVAPAPTEPLRPKSSPARPRRDRPKARPAVPPIVAPPKVTPPKVAPLVEAAPPVEAAPKEPVVAPPVEPAKPRFELKPVRTRDEQKKDLFRMKKVD